MIKREYKKINIKDLIAYERNNKIHGDNVDEIVKSIQANTYISPIIVDENMIILAGHGRKLALDKLGVIEADILIISGLTDIQKRDFRIRDNKLAELSTWDLDNLSIELDSIQDNSINELFDLESNLDIEDDVVYNEGKKGSLCDKFLVPPYSILDTKSGYWQDRKRLRLGLGIKSEIGRGNDILGSGLKVLAERQSQGGKGSKFAETAGISIFDPVLCEIIYSWFCKKGGKIIDPFAGGSVRGIVAGYLGYTYHGNDLRKEQIEENIKQSIIVMGSNKGVAPSYYSGCSTNIDKIIQESDFDLFFTCPPYFDLEVYSNDPKDISNMEYEEFLNSFNTIVQKTANKMKQNTFAICVVGDVRKKNGEYIGLVEDTKNIYKNNGYVFYNDIILLNCIGMGALRAAKTFQSYRKVIKLHQNVLCFYKGDTKRIKNMGDVDIDTSIFVD